MNLELFDKEFQSVIINDYHNQFTPLVTKNTYV